MDINFYLAREQVELALARASTDPGARAAHNGLADRYRAMIDGHRRAAVERSAPRLAGAA